MRLHVACSDPGEIRKARKQRNKPCLGSWRMAVNLTHISDLETRNGDDQFAGVVASRAGTNEDMYAQDESRVDAFPGIVGQSGALREVLPPSTRLRTNMPRTGHAGSEINDSERIARIRAAMKAGLEFIQTARLRDSELPFSDGTGPLEAISALQSAVEDLERLKEQLYRENLALRDEVKQVSMFEEIVGTSPALQTVLSRISKVAPSDSTVLITGETGTGKKLVARAIHRRSHTPGRAFSSVICAAI